MELGIIGCGAIAGYVVQALRDAPVRIVLAVVEPGREADARALFGEHVHCVTSAHSLPVRPALVLDCAGHGALRAHGPAVLEAGIELASVSSGALADVELLDTLAAAATRGGTRMRLVSGAIGALDALAAASAGELTRVVYTGRKPPRGWVGSPAADVLDLDNLPAAAVHFRGTAREAALRYPKNANVAASVALAGLGFDRTEVELIADPDVARNIHQIHAEGQFGSFDFRIAGNALPSNPKSSALTAMSVVREVLRRRQSVQI